MYTVQNVCIDTCIYEAVYEMTGFFFHEGEECQYWNMFYRYGSRSIPKRVKLIKDKEKKKTRDYHIMLGHHTHLKNHKRFGVEQGEHNYCRAFVHNYLRVGQVRPPECLKMSARKYFVDAPPKMFEHIEECDVPVCSPCMYGDGRGNLPPYKHKLPIYNGTIRETFRQ